MKRGWLYDQCVEKLVLKRAICSFFVLKYYVLNYFYNILNYVFLEHSEIGRGLKEMIEWKRRYEIPSFAHGFVYACNYSYGHKPKYVWLYTWYIYGYIYDYWSPDPLQVQ